MESFIGWIGGKRMRRKAILERFPTDEVGRYIEVFGGAAWVLFAKEKKANQLEVYNDINSNLVNLFRCVKYHCGEMCIRDRLQIDHRWHNQRHQCGQL